MQTFNFLFVPEAILSVIFLIIFFILFTFGIWLYKKCNDELNNLNDNAESLYESVSNKVSPESFIRASVDKISAREGILEGIPDAFVSIGILATFIGLGVAIQGAAELLSTDNIELDKLIDLLGIIAFKFQTSVWGILFSLIFRRFVVENYFSRRQSIIDNVRERLYEKERDGIRTLLEKQNIFLENQLEYQKKTDTKNHTELIDQLNNFQKSLLQSNEQHQNLLNQQFHEVITIRQNLDSYLEITKEFILAVKKFTRDTNTFSGYVNDYRQEVEHFTTQTTTSLENLGLQQFDTLCEIKTGIENMQHIFLRDEDRFVEEIRQKLSKMLNDTGETFKRTLDNSIDKVSNDYNAVLQSFNDKFENSINKLNDEYTQEVRHFGDVANNISKALNGIDDNVQSLHTALLNEQKSIIDTNLNSFDKVEKIINGFSVATEQQTNSMMSIYTQMNELLKNIEGTNQKALSDQNETLRQFTNALTSTINLMLKNQREEFDERNEKLNTTFASIENVAKSTSLEQVRMDKNMRDFQNEVLKKYADSLDNLNKKMHEAFDKLNTSMSDSIGKLNESMNDSTEKANESTKSSMHILNQSLVEGQDNLLKVMNGNNNLLRAIQNDLIRALERSSEQQKESMALQNTSLETLNNSVLSEKSEIANEIKVLQDEFRAIAKELSNQNELLTSLAKNREKLAEEIKSLATPKSIQTQLQPQSQTLLQPQTPSQPQTLSSPLTPSLPTPQSKAKSVLTKKSSKKGKK